VEDHTAESTGQRLPGVGTDILPGQEALQKLYTRTATVPATGTMAQRRTRPDPARHPIREIDLEALSEMDGERIYATVESLLSPRMQAGAAGEEIVNAEGVPYASASELHQAVLCALLVHLDDQRAVAAFLATPCGQEFLFANEVRESNMGRRLARAVANARAYLDAIPSTTGTRCVPIDHAIFDASVVLGPYGVAVAVAVASHLPNPHPSQERLARMLGINAKTVKEGWDRLEASGVMSSNAHGRGKRFTFVSTDTPAILVPCALRSEERAKESRRRAVAEIAAYVLIAGCTATGEPPGQDEIAEALAIHRQRINPAVTALVRGEYIVVETHAHNRKTYQPAVIARPVVRNTETNLYTVGGCAAAGQRRPPQPCRGGRGRSGFARSPSARMRSTPCDAATGRRGGRSMWGRWPGCSTNSSQG
jgi:DNA-binding transcriptional regulator YhcF (GntR family)